MHMSMRPLVHSGVSGSTSAHSAVGRSARRLYPAPSLSASPSTCPQSAQLLNAHVELSRATASASSASDLASDASTTAVLASRALERTFNGAVTSTWSHEAHLPEHFPRPPALESDEPQPVASTSAPGDPVTHLVPAKRRRRGGKAVTTSPRVPDQSASTSNSGAASGTHDTGASAGQGPPGAPAIAQQLTPQHPLEPSWALLAKRSNNAVAPRSGRPVVAPTRPRLRPPPPPISWPDYPYSRSPVASACSPYDTAGLKLEALFQCVLHYPRAPPRLLRFLRRAVPDDVEPRLAAITATVECLAGTVGREVAVYLIRRSAWVVLVPADALAPRMEAVRRLLGLQPGGVPDLLRKNPNLLRMHESSLMGRYKALQEALYDAVGFDEQQLRALVLKYPLILNFKHESVHSALMALRRLCSARPDWTALYRALSPSQVAFFIRERVVTLLRLEYLLLTGGGSGLTLRDIMKTSNNSFNRTHGGFRSWMQARLVRLRQRLAQARRAVEARAQAEGRQVSPEDMERVAEEVQVQYAKAEQERFHSEFMQRRDEERRDMAKRMEQRQRTIEERMQQDQRRQQQRQGGGSEGVEAEEENEQRRGRLQQDQRLGSGGTAAARAAGSPSAGVPPAGGVRQGGRPATPPVAAVLSTDPLERVTLGRVWQRPGSKVPAGPGFGGPARQYRH